MKSSLLSLFAVGISLQAIPASLAEENKIFTLTPPKETERTYFSSLKPKSPMPMLQSLPNSSYATSMESYRLRPGVKLPKGRESLSSNIVEPSNYGKTKYSYTTAVVKPLSSPKKKDLNNVATSARPYLTAGKLWMRKGGRWYICSGSLIGKGVVATAAHCIADWGGGSSSIASTVYFIPAATKNNSIASNAGPIGTWGVKKIVLPGCYTAGTCANTAGGVISSNDLALLVLDGPVKNLPFAKGAGTYGYGWNGYGFTTGNKFINRSKKLGQITQLGYPAALGDTSRNRGGAMMRTDSMAVYYQPVKNVKNFIWGSQQTGGSSGGPEITNFGRKPNISASAGGGYRKLRNILVGVTSWGYTDKNQQVQGASWFGQNKEYPKSQYKDSANKNWGAGNIGSLMRTVCGKGTGNLNLNSNYCGY